MTTVWTVKGGRHGEREELMLSEGLLGGGWEALGSLEGIGSKEELAEVYRRSYPESSERRTSAQVAQLWSLLSRMQDGDLVVLPVKTTGTIAVGRIAGPYEYREDLREDTQHVRSVEWLATDVPRDEFDQDLLYSFGALLTIGRVRREEADTRVLSVIERHQDTPAVEAAPVSYGEVVDSTDETEQPPDVAATAREQVRQFISRTFLGHDLARLVSAVLEAQGFEVTQSPAGPDRGVDILAGSGPLGLDKPRLVVQVKTAQADVETYRALRGTMQAFGAEQGLLVAWRGFRGTVRAEARPDHFTVRLWDADDLLDELEKVYDRLADDIRSELPLQRVWALVPEAEES